MIVPQRTMSDGSTMQGARCPVCGVIHNAATCMDDPAARPKSGEFSICNQCGELLVFDDLGLLLKPKAEDLKRLEPDQLQMIEETQRFIRQQNPQPERKS